MFGALTIALATLGVAPPDTDASSIAPARSAASEPESDSADSDPAAAEARRAFNRGTTLYETQRFDEAIEAFTSAFELAAEIEDEELRRRTSSVMLFNLARVHLGSFSVDRNVEHLRQAENLLHKYRAAEQEMGHDPDSDVDLRRLERELAGALEDVEAERQRSAGPDPQAGDRKSKPQPALFWSGVGSFALAGASLGVMGAGLGLGSVAEQDYVGEPTASGREDIDQRGRNANILAIAGGASAGVFAAVGTGLIVAAYRKGRGDQTHLEPPRWWVRGHAVREFAGVSLGGRF